MSNQHRYRCTYLTNSLPLITLSILRFSLDIESIFCLYVRMFCCDKTFLCMFVFVSYCIPTKSSNLPLVLTPHRHFQGRPSSTVGIYFYWVLFTYMFPHPPTFLWGSPSYLWTSMTFISTMKLRRTSLPPPLSMMSLSFPSLSRTRSSHHHRKYQLPGSIPGTGVEERRNRSISRGTRLGCLSVSRSFR